MFYINKNRTMCVNSSIVEWDIHSGNTSMMYHYNLAPKPVIDKLAAMNKQDRVVAIGKLMKKDKEFSKKLEASFNSIAQDFVEINEIPRENIISIKRDAVYVLNRDIKFSTFGQYVEFVPKNQYTGWLYIKPYEFYFKDDSTIDVKGLSDNLIPKHEHGMLAFLSDLFDTCRASNMGKGDINQFMAEFSENYKFRRLKDDFYREFNQKSLYRLVYPDIGEMLTESFPERDLEYVDISYNYLNIIIKAIKIC